MECVAEFERGVTAHGLEVWVRRVPSRQVALGIVVFCGMRQDPIEQPGLSHALEHALATQDGPCGNLIGKQRFAYRHCCRPFDMGSTSTEITRGMIRGRTAELPLMLRWLAVIMRRSPKTFSLKRLTDILIREYAEQRDPRDCMLSNRIWAPIIPEHHPIFAPERPEFIGRLNRRILAAHWEQHYTLPNMALVAVGDTTMGGMCAAAERAFPVTTRDKHAQRSVVAPMSAPPALYGVLQLDLSAIVGCPTQGRDLKMKLCRALPARALSYETITVALETLEDTVFMELRERRGFVYSVETYIAAFRDLWANEFCVTVSPERCGVVADVLCDLPRFIARRGSVVFTDTRRRLITEHILRDRTMEGTVEAATENLAAFGAIESRRKVLRAISATTFDDVRRTLQELFAHERALTVVVYP